MATDIAGLFTTPEQYQLAQQQAQEAQAIQYANLDPMARANYATYRAGQQFGSAIGGALGGQDPQLKLISQRQQLASQLDPSDPQSYMKVAQFAAQSGDQQFAMAVADAGREAAVKVAQANKERQLAVPADIQKIQMIPQIQGAIAKLKAVPQTPEIEQQITSLERMMSVIAPEQKAEKVPDALQVAKRVSELKTQLSPDTGVVLPPQVRVGLEAELGNLEKIQKENIIDVGVAEKTREVVYFDKNTKQQFIMKPNPTNTNELIPVPYSGGIDKTTALTKVSATATTKQNEGVNQNKINMAQSIEESAFSAPDRISLAQSLRELAPKAFTGFAADAKLSASKVATAFGIPTKGGSESEIIDQILGQMTLGAAGQLKGSLSDKDVLFLKKTIGTRGLSLNTLMFVADEIERLAVQDRHLNKSINKVTSSGGNLNQVNFEEEKSKSASFVKNQMSEYRGLMKKAQNNVAIENMTPAQRTTALEEAKRAKQIRDELGLQ
jgi:hypothetical protein